MSTTTIIQDLRRTDQRVNVLENPFWLSSGVVDATASAAIDDKVIVLFSFPVAGQQILVLNFCCHVITAFTAGTTGVVGYYTLATDAVTTAGVATVVGSVNQLEETTNTTYTTIGWYFPAAAADATQYRIAGTPTVDADWIVGAATAVYSVCATFSNASTVLAGKCQYHMLVTVIPGT
jgi:hypothetical protein